MKATFEFSSLQEIEEYHAYVMRTHPLARIASTPGAIPVLEELISITEPIQHHDHIQPQIPLKYHPLVSSKETVDEIKQFVEEQKAERRPIGRPKKQVSPGEQLRAILEECRINKEPFSPSAHRKKFTINLGMNEGQFYTVIKRFMDDPFTGKSFKKIKSEPRNQIMYQHTGIVRIPTESKPGLKAIQPKGAPAKRAFAPRPTMTDEEWEKEQEYMKA